MKFLRDHRRLFNEQLDKEQKSEHRKKAKVSIDHINIGAQAKQRRKSAHDDHCIAMAKLFHQ